LFKAALVARTLSPRANNTGSGEGGPCLTDAAPAAAPDEPLASGFAATL
jgi:hypothetical protein